jgi:single-strand DNA-binding protein
MIKVQMIGRVGGDPTTRQTAKGRPVANFNVAIHGEKDDKGEAKATWYPITCWDGRADLAADLLNAGDLVYVEGTPELNTWSDRNGKERTDIQVTAKFLQLLSRGKAGLEKKAAGGYTKGGSYGSKANTQNKDDDFGDLPF